MVYQKQDVYHDLRRRIIEEELNPGAPLVERDVSATYKVSRTPVREALRRLVADGLVVLDRGRGYSVRRMTIEDIIEIFVAREAVEATISSLATAHMDASLRDALLRLRDQLRDVDVQQDPGAAVNLGRQLHDLLATTADNGVLFDFYQKLRDVTMLTRNVSKRSADVEVASREDHLRIIEAVLCGRRDDAERYMRLHLRGTCERLVAAYLQRRTATLSLVSSDPVELPAEAEICSCGKTTMSSVKSSVL